MAGIPTVLYEKLEALAIQAVESGETDELAIFLQKLSNIRLSDEIGRYKRMWMNAQVLADGFLEIERKIERFYDPVDHEIASLDKIKELVDGFRKAANDQADSQSPEKRTEE